ncbi:MAG TPA: elongation factor P [Phycisphaerae bacterium]|nr:elongation factor P [Phycisphaerae bacterium]
MSIKAIDCRKGMAVGYKDGIWLIVSNEKVAKGNWRSYQVIQLKNMKTGQLIQDRFRTDEQFEEVFLERKEMEYLYSTGANHVVMDQQSFEQVELPVELFGDQSVYLTPNIRIQVAFIDGKAVTVDLPNTVELKVVDTPPQVKGATATNQLKDAVCEGGAKIRVPPFVENGTMVKVDTRTGEYLGRA